MSTSSYSWRDEATILAWWTYVSESPEWIAERVQRFVERANAAAGTETWSFSDSTNWGGSSDDRVALVRAHPSTGATGAPDPAQGYAFSIMSKTAKGLAIDVYVSAGDVDPGGRVPLHKVLVSFPSRDRVPSLALLEALFAATVDVFEPAVAGLNARSVGRIARRGGWKVAPGYRVFVSRDVASGIEPSEGVEAAPVAGGTVLSVPDEFEPQAVVDAMLATFEANGIDDVAH